jgi:hypothetical protein
MLGNGSRLGEPARLIALATLNVVALLALRTRAPLEAKRVVDALGRNIPPLSIEEAKRSAARLARWGTCLSRSMAIASLLPGSEVVIGVELSPAAGGAALHAHAWVEMDGEIVTATHGTLKEIARLH